MTANAEIHTGLAAVQFPQSAKAMVKEEEESWA